MFDSRFLKTPFFGIIMPIRLLSWLLLLFFIQNIVEPLQSKRLKTKKVGLNKAQSKYYYSHKNSKNVAVNTKSKDLKSKSKLFKISKTLNKVSKKQSIETLPEPKIDINRIKEYAKNTDIQTLDSLKIQTDNNIEIINDIINDYYKYSLQIIVNINESVLLESDIMFSKLQYNTKNNIEIPLHSIVNALNNSDNNQNINQNINHNINTNEIQLGLMSCITGITGNFEHNCMIKIWIPHSLETLFKIKQISIFYDCIHLSFSDLLTLNIHLINTINSFHYNTNFNKYYPLIHTSFVHMSFLIACLVYVACENGCVCTNLFN